MRRSPHRRSVPPCPSAFRMERHLPRLQPSFVWAPVLLLRLGDLGPSDLIGELDEGDAHGAHRHELTFPVPVP